MKSRVSILCLAIGLAFALGGAPAASEPKDVYGATQLSALVNALDAHTTDANYDATVDYNSDGVVNNMDFTFLTAHWGQPISP